MTIPQALAAKRSYTQYNPICRLMQLVYQVAGGEGNMFPDLDDNETVRPDITMRESGELDISALLPALTKLGWKPPD